MPTARRVPARAGILLCAAILAALPAGAQDGPRRPPQVDATTLALNFMLGRFRMPVTCTREDGSLLEIEEAVVFRPAPQRSGSATIRATFFGIDAAEAARCYNLVEPQVPDRRGFLLLTYRAQNRPDMGLADFRRALKRGPLRYHIIGGRLQIRSLADPEAEPRVVRFNAANVPFVVRDLPPGSDEDKLLDRYGNAERSDGRVPRRLLFEIGGPEDFRFRGFYIEDDRRWR
jgi:hypothetical protein